MEKDDFIGTGQIVEKGIEELDNEYRSNCYAQKVQILEEIKELITLVIGIFVNF